MKQPLLVTLLSCLFMTAYAQRPTLKELASLFNKVSTYTSVNSFLLLKGFTYQGKDDDFYNYELPAWGDACDIQVGYENGRLNVLSVRQSVIYYQSTLLSLYQNQFTLGKYFPPQSVVNGMPVPQPGSLFDFTNKVLHLICSLDFPIQNDNTFSTVYGRY